MLEVFRAESRIMNGEFSRCLDFDFFGRIAKDCLQLYASNCILMRAIDTLHGAP